MVTSEMTTTLTHQAYQISHDDSHREGYGEAELPEYDAWLIEFPGCQEVQFGFWEPQVITMSGSEGFLAGEEGIDGLWHTTQFHLPERIEFESAGNFLMIHDLRRTRVTDYPYNREGWPIMSKRMLEVLLSVREFPHQVVPIVMLDAFTPLEFEENHDYVAVQLLEHQDVFDWGKSIYERNPELPNCIESSSLEKLVLRNPSGGFPPLFRIGTAPLQTKLYVSAEGRTALEVAGIRGVNFVQLRGSWLP
jgi:hypothetical protein